MNAVRLWNQLAPTLVRKNINAIFIFAAILGILFLGKLYHGSRSKRAGRPPKWVCPSMKNFLLKDIYATDGIHIIPSTPEKNSTKDGHVGKQDDADKADCVTLTTPDHHLVAICIHNPSKDLMVSANIKHAGSWEKENVQAMADMFSEFPGLMLVDLGCNIGAYTISAAHLGMEVLAVDAVLPSLKLLQRSLLINSLSCPVTLVHNALYSERQKMRVALDPTNIGGSQVLEILDFRKDKIPADKIVDAICLDDLVPFVRGKDVFLKMDLETSEVHVLQCAHEFFTQANVQVLLIEWMFYRHNEESSEIIKNFLISHSMVPTWGVDLQRPIDVYASHSWPDNVFWRKAS